MSGLNNSELQAQLASVERAIADAQFDINRMRNRICELRSSGRHTGRAQTVLASFLIDYSVFQTRREIILLTLSSSLEEAP